MDLMKKRDAACSDVYGEADAPLDLALCRLLFKRRAFL